MRRPLALLDNLPPLMNPHKAHPKVSSRLSWLERLDKGMAYRLTLLVAPKGSGKSTLLRQWVAARNWPVAWVALKTDHNTSARFLLDLIKALRGIEPKVEAILPRLRDGEALEDILIELINALTAVPDDFALILDDYHVIEAPLVHAVVEAMLEYPPPQMHMVIAARREPPLPLSRLRVRRQLLRLDLLPGP